MKERVKRRKHTILALQSLSPSPNLIFWNASRQNLVNDNIHSKNELGSRGLWEEVALARNQREEEANTRRDVKAVTIYNYS